MKNGQKAAVSVLMGAASSLAIFSSGVAFAQDAQPASAEDIVVTGFRQSLATALETKRESNLIIESVSAEDIGKFPDQNIAESLQRLPGIQIDRENGQGTKVRIRGLEQTVTLLNDEQFLTGLEIFKVGEGNFVRDSSLEGVPSELIGGVEVYKSGNAQLLEGGLGGVVNLRTRSPLDLDEGFTVVGNARMGKADGTSKWEPGGAIVAGWNSGDRFGVIASFSYDKSRSRASVLGGDNRGNWRFTERADAARVPNYYAPEYRYVTDREQERKRWGASVGARFQPSDGIEFAADWFHQELDIVTSEASLKFPFAPAEGQGLVAGTPFDIDGNGVLLSGTVRAQSAEAISFVDVFSSKADNFQFGGNFEILSNFRASVQAVYSKASTSRDVANNDVRYTAYSVPTANAASPTGFAHAPGNPGAPATFDFVYDNAGGKFPTFGLGQNSPQDLFSNPAYGYFKSHWVFGDRSDIDGLAIKSDLSWDAIQGDSGTLTITGGFRFAERNVDFTSGRYLADYSGKGEVNAVGLPQAIKDQYPDYQFNWTPYGYFQDGAVGFKSCELPIASMRPRGCDNRFGNSPPLITPFQTLAGTPGRVEEVTDFAGGGKVAGDTVLVQDRSQMRDPAAWIQALYPDTPFAFYPEALESFNVREETQSAYVMADYGGDGDPFHINAGVRVIKTDLVVGQSQSAANPSYIGTDSWNGVSRDYVVNNIRRSYTDWLPSLNISYNVNEQLKLRGAAGKVVARQDLFDLGRGFRADFTRNANTNLFEFTSGNSGNPELDPFRAWTFDASAEYYFGTQGLVSVGLFWKEVDSFIVEETVPVFVGDQGGGRIGPVTLPVNGEGGRVRGFEVGAQYAFDFGLGFAVNYTLSDTKTSGFNDFSDSLPLPGVSKHSANGQVYYEMSGFAARLSYSWRSEAYVGNFGFRDGNITRTLGIYDRPYGQLDGQISYDFNENIGVFVEGINLTEESRSSYLQFENLPFRYESGSRRVNIGARVRF